MADDIILERMFFLCEADAVPFGDGIPTHSGRRFVGVRHLPRPVRSAPSTRSAPRRSAPLRSMIRGLTLPRLKVPHEAARLQSPPLALVFSCGSNCQEDRDRNNRVRWVSLCRVLGLTRAD